MEEVNPRCLWCHGSELYEHYHDHEWGRPLRGEQEVFEFLLLETFQAGLSWITVLKKREAFREVFHGFDIEQVAAMTEEECERALLDPRIIRNRAKVYAAVNNAQRTLEFRKEGTTLSNWLWSFVNHQPLQNNWERMDQLPAATPLADEISKALKKRGFKFVGPTVVYAHMQATGMVNDHLVSCPAYSDCAKEA